MDEELICGTEVEIDEYEKLEWLHFAVSEAINGNIGELSDALAIIEELREAHLIEKETI